MWGYRRSPTYGRIGWRTKTGFRSGSLPAPNSVWGVRSAAWVTVLIGMDKLAHDRVKEAKFYNKVMAYGPAWFFGTRRMCACFEMRHWRSNGPWPGSTPMDRLPPCGHPKRVDQDRYLPTMGNLRPTPNALGDTRSTGAAWWRLNSLMFTSRKALLTVASSKPIRMISWGPWRCSMYW